MVSQQRKIECPTRSNAGSEVLAEIERIDVSPVADVGKALLCTDATFGSGILVPQPQDDPADDWTWDSRIVDQPESRNRRAAVRPVISCRSSCEALVTSAIRPRGSGSPMSNG